MRVLLLTFGTQGDVQPYVALAAGLGAAGHDVALCTADGYRELVESAGVAYLHMGNEMLALVRTGMSQMKRPSDAPHRVTFPTQIISDGPQLFTDNHSSLPGLFEAQTPGSGALEAVALWPEEPAPRPTPT